MVKTTKKNSKKPENTWSYLAYCALAGAMAYGFGSWAIDSGSWWHYLFMFVSLYFVAHYLKIFISRQFFDNDNRAKTRRS